MATQRNSEQSTDDPVLTRLKVVETDLAIIKSNYATKEDIARLEHAMTSGDARLDHAMAAGDARLEQAIIAGDARLEIKMAQLETRLIKWFVGTAITLSAAVGAISFSIARFIH